MTLKRNINSREDLKTFIAEYLKVKGETTSNEIVNYIEKHDLASKNMMLNARRVSQLLARFGAPAGEKRAGSEMRWIIYRWNGNVRKKRSSRPCEDILCERPKERPKRSEEVGKASQSPTSALREKGWWRR